MDFTFVVNGEPENRKRKTVQGACDRCKRRKKRCIHHDGRNAARPSQSTTPPNDEIHAGSRRSRQSISGESLEEGKHEQAHAPGFESRHTSTPSPTTRFVGDLNPEASMIVDAHSERIPTRDRHSLGIWLDREHHHERLSKSTAHVFRRGEDTITGQRTRHAITDVPSTSEPVLPSKNDLTGLIDLYFARLHPLLPILDEDNFRWAFSNGTASPMILQAICLVISKDVKARPYLSLSESPPCSQSEFSSTLCHNIKMAISQRRERNRIVLIQTLALLSLHTESGPYGGEDASMHLAQAIHHAQTIGLQLGRSRHQDQIYDKLFWCLWCLSTLNAASNGRPRLINDEDVGLRLEDVLDACHPAFRILLMLSKLFLKVIQLYQPTTNPEIIGVDEDFPSFEIIVHQNNGWEVEASMLTSLELYYHAISILSYRTQSTDDVEIAKPSASSLRQALSAQQVMRILQHTSPRALLPLPTVSYGISLALSQTYRQFRRSRSATKRAIAQEQLECYVHALESKSDSCEFALTMAAIGRKVLTQIERLNETVARQAAEASDSQTFELSEQHRASRRSSRVTTHEFGGTRVGIDQAIGGAQYYGTMDTFGGFDGLFAEDGTLQAMDTVFDNFMGLDLPNELYNASLTDNGLGIGLAVDQ